MPIIEYVCKECAHKFEIIVLGSTVPACPSCTSAQLEKRFSVFAVGKSTGLAEELPQCNTCADPCGEGTCAMH